MAVHVTFDKGIHCNDTTNMQEGAPAVYKPAQPVVASSTNGASTFHCATIQSQKYAAQLSKCNR